MAYFSNGSEGDVLHKQCEDCPLNGGAPEDNDCPVLMAHELFNYEQCEDGQDGLRTTLELLVSEDGTCQIRKRAMVTG